MRNVINTYVIVAVASAVVAVAMALLAVAGCKMSFGELDAKDFSSEVLPALMSDTSKGAEK